MKDITKIARYLKKSNNIPAIIIKYFKANPNPNDEQIHALADQLGIAHDELELNIYSVLTSLLHRKIPGGLAEGRIPEDFDPEQIKKGIEVEMEHTNDPGIAKEITMDHLVENPKYYDYLEEMEKKFESEKQ